MAKEAADKPQAAAQIAALPVISANEAAAMANTQTVMGTWHEGKQTATRVMMMRMWLRSLQTLNLRLQPEEYQRLAGNGDEEHASMPKGQPHGNYACYKT